jgi:hypothetical protein
MRFHNSSGTSQMVGKAFFFFIGLSLVETKIIGLQRVLR